MSERTVATTCPYCGVGCGITAQPGADRVLGVTGDRSHPANHGRLCVKGAALGETVGLEGRLLYPKLDGRRVDWGVALDTLADQFRRAIRRKGPDSVAFYVSGQLLTEDYYVANKLMKGFIGSANIDTNSRLCMASSVAGHVRAFGEDVVPGCYEDIEQADLVVLVGSNTAWCHPVLYQRLQAARAARPGLRFVVIDPRRTATAEGCDLHLGLRPGSDVALFNGLLAHLAATGATDEAFVAAHTSGMAAALAAAFAEGDPAAACDLDPSDLETFYRWFAATSRVVTIYSQGVNQSSSGTDKVNAIINCHLLTGRIGRPGMGPLSLTGQPNAMGGREVGGLANQLAAHMGFDDASRDRVARFWGVERVAPSPGLKAVDLFRAVDEGKIEALWVIATNPVVSMPETALVRRALERCHFVAVSDCMERTDTTQRAHLLLPALGWGEKDGTVTNSERRISRQRAMLPAPGEAEPDWWMICGLARRLGHGAAFDYPAAAAIFQEHARLSGFENEGRAFDISGLAEADYDNLAPVQWPVPVGATEGTARLYGDGRFSHSDGRARFVPVTARPPVALAGEAFPLILNTGRTRDQWHTMTRTGLAPRLATHAPEPFLAIHPDDAARHGLADRGLTRVESPHGAVVLRVTFDPGQRRGEVFAPMHWNDRFAGAAGIGALIAAVTDPISGQPELKHTPIRVAPVAVAWQGILVSRSEIALPAEGLAWSRAAGEGHWLYRLAGTGPIPDWRGWREAWLGAGDWLDYRDSRLNLYRAARFDEQRLEAALFVGVAADEMAADQFARFFDGRPLKGIERGAVLSGAAVARADRGPIVCACHQVGRRAIEAALVDPDVTGVEAIGARLGAGTGCGSCLPELRAIVAAYRALPAGAQPNATFSADL